MSPETRIALDELSRELDLEPRLTPFGALRYRGLHDAKGGGLALHIDDLSALPLLDGITGIEFYQHRARVRSGDGDLFVTVTDACEGYEEYCRTKLRLGRPELVVVEAPANPIHVARAATASRAWSRIVERARRASHVVVHPYMAHEAVWELAGRLRDAASRPTTVLGPPPPITWLANDKRLFSEIVSRTLGAEALAETRVARSASALAAALVELAKRHPRVGLKRSRSVSGMGNEVFDGAELLLASHLEVLERVEAFLRRTGEHEDEPVLAVAWETSSVSPSSQLWIPPLGSGAPRLDGIFEQILDDGVFIGSRPSTLPHCVHRMIRDAAISVARSLQYLGYVGRCSFDHVVVGDLETSPRVLFVDCNGRWGGTSTPMNLVDRLFAHAPRRATYRAQDFTATRLTGVPFTEILEAIGGQLFDPVTRSGRYVFYNVEPLARWGKMDVIAFGRDRAASDAALLEDLPKLLKI
ncbi:hypothetical protein [Pendulispora albinea]|uniref:Pre ATP-grasp domain-containing protein n=1 Tax=Pendulispora albinea TaxID=2741071 RepID=A0ABZ2LKS3_9BACT